MPRSHSQRATAWPSCSIARNRYAPPGATITAVGEVASGTCGVSVARVTLRTTVTPGANGAGPISSPTGSSGRSESSDANAGDWCELVRRVAGLLGAHPALAAATRAHGAHDGVGDL